VGLALALLGTSRPAAAQEELLPTASPSWILLSETRTTAVRLDTTRIIDYGAYMGAWFLLQRRRELRDPSGRDLRGSAFFEELDCAQFLSRRWEIHALGPRGNVVDILVASQSGWVPFRLHPVGEAAMAQACLLFGRSTPARPHGG
jgi:hypothetical protein